MPGSEVFVEVSMDVNFFLNYATRLQTVLSQCPWEKVLCLAETLRTAWQERQHVFLCGNGGSAANAMHMANDFLYGISKTDGRGLRVVALPSNPSVLTCLANDVSYTDIFSQQLAVLAQPGDILIALSCSGNSPNIIKAIQKSKEMRLKTFAILGYSGGKCLKLVDAAIHFPVDDMQIAEDCQQIVGHMLTSWLANNPVDR